MKTKDCYELDDFSDATPGYSYDPERELFAFCMGLCAVIAVGVLILELAKYVGSY